jgi:hypothetical protein
VYNNTNGTNIETDFSQDTFADDVATQGGGAAFDTGDVSFENDTFVGDGATDDYGGALLGDGFGYMGIGDDTLAQDTAPTGSGIYEDDFTQLDLVGSIFDGVTCAATEGSGLDDQGYNVDSGDTCSKVSTSRYDDSTIGLATTLAPNGSNGPETLAIGPTSSAVGLVPSVYCSPKTDERGDPRPGIFYTKNCDAGAYEFQTSSPSAPQHVKAIAGNASASVSWRNPASDGDLAITSFRLYCGATKTVSTKGKPVATLKPTVLLDKLSKLSNGVRYYCVVVAVNPQGSSVPSTVVEFEPHR